MNSEYNLARDLIDARTGRVHMMGVAGVGMAGLAAHLHWMGFEVSGCDLKENRLTEWLAGLGVIAELGHDPKHLPANLSALIRSTAVPSSHSEVVAARARNVPVLRRGEVLAAIVNARRSVAVCGTHGKTSTAAMLAQVLRGAGVDAGFFVGAEVDRLGGVAGRGDEIFVAEADESDGTLRLYHPDYTILTNADIDHLENYAGEDDLWECFGEVASNTRNKLIYNTDDARANKIGQGCAGSIGFGFEDGAAVCGRNYRQSADGCRFKLVLDGAGVAEISLATPGLHNAYNALAVCALARELGVDMDVLVRELALCGLPRRRFERICSLNGAEIYMDYSHHPTEIRALLQSIENMGYRRLITIFQPHRYTRTLALGSSFPSSFLGVDRLVLAPVFAASEDPIEGGTSGDLYRHFESVPSVEVSLAADLRSAWSEVRSMLAPGDMLLLIGAGDIEMVADWAREG